MGLYDRDYIREESRQGGFFGAGGPTTPVVKALLAINIGVFLIQLFSTPNTGNTSWIQNIFQLDGERVAKGEVWRLITSAFCHSTSQFLHIVFNLFLLFMFGRELERKYGSREFLAFYLIAALVSGLAFLGLNLVTGKINPAIGASGAVMAVMVLYACNFPKRKVLLWFMVPIEIRWLIAILLFLDLTPAMAALGGKDFETGIAHAAHLGGMLFGYLYWKAGKKLGWILGKPGGAKQKKPRKKKPDLSEFGSKAEVDKQVDALLQKISDDGFQSLTDKEKKFLEKASDRFGKK